ncbi:MAG: hypothetical protein J7M21_01960 [Planctomycetes bacterium]|nr:hypothetical protein [Planctomycetota bacterium]
MRAALASVAVLFMLAAAGCVHKAELQADDEVTNVAAGQGLQVKLQLARRYFRSGEQVRVTVTAVNTTARPIEITSPTGAPVLVRITRASRLAPEEIKVYPRTTTSNILSWTLPAGRSRTFVLMVPVEPDWPVNEILFLSAELNGYPAIAPSVAIMVRSPAARR